MVEVRVGEKNATEPLGLKRQTSPVPFLRPELALHHPAIDQELGPAPIPQPVTRSGHLLEFRRDDGKSGLKIGRGGNS
jgi:hypothetical protein